MSSTSSSISMFDQMTNEKSQMVNGKWFLLHWPTCACLLRQPLHPAPSA
jgi:hypothetical protein